MKDEYLFILELVNKLDSDIIKTVFRFILKGRIHINRLNLHYTHEMEKAMHQSHGVGYEVYSRKLTVRMKVEEKREKDYRKSLKIVKGIVNY